jgi:hypothetical protein
VIACGNVCRRHRKIALNAQVASGCCGTPSLSTRRTRRPCF